MLRFQRALAGIFVGLVSAIAIAKPIESLQQKAVDAALWGYPMVAMDFVRQAYFRDAHAKYNDLVYLPLDAKNQMTTPNSSVLILYVNYNTKNGPVVVEIPESKDAEIFGSINNAWQTPMEDVDLDGAKYLILPPGYNKPLPKGYVVVKPETFNSYSLFRVIPDPLAIEVTAKEFQQAMDLSAKIKVYPLSQAKKPPMNRFIDLRKKNFNALVSFDRNFFTSLARMFAEEPSLAQDAEMAKAFKAIGIEKGRKFNPDRQTGILIAAMKEVHQHLQDSSAGALVPWFKNSHWGLNESLIAGSKSRFSFKTEKTFDYRARAVAFFLVFAPPATLGEKALYLEAFKDAQGMVLRGEQNYSLRIPAEVPSEIFWALNVYDLQTGGFFENSPKVGIDSYQKIKANDDGTIDVVFGPHEPKDKKANWIYTRPGKTWFALFRLYGPEKPVLMQAWPMPDIQKQPLQKLSKM
ncbi:MAG: DUF1254 domain-containing protein [Bdellovibrionales bacterium]|nr:DUF1254 domain-containing protein [Bdellovibrionales bacterium]